MDDFTHPRDSACCGGATGESTDAQPPVQAVRDEALYAILQDLKSGQSEMINKIDSLVVRVDNMQTRIGEIASRTTDAEQRISMLEDQMVTLTNKSRVMERELKTAVDHAEDLEGRSRRNNVRLVGLREGVETGRMEEFLEDLLPTILDHPTFSSHFVVERAHRVPGSRPEPGRPPRPIIAKLLNYRDRDTILKAAREKGELRYENSVLSIFPDFSVAVQKSRKSFDATKKILRAKQIKYAMMYPAKLKIIHANKVSFFTNPEEACSFAESIT